MSPKGHHEKAGNVKGHPEEITLLKPWR
jgi:hypothetical protein